MLLNILIGYLLLSAVIAQLLLIWFNTNAFVEYMTVLRVNKLAISEFKEVTVDDPALSYPIYLSMNYDSFFIRMISCPKCLGVQLSILLNLILFAVLTKFNWTILLFPFSVLITSYFSLVMYLILVRLLKYE